MPEPRKEVIAAVIQQEEKYLVCRRPAHKTHGGLWEFPGGKIETGETLLQAAQRELKEELSLHVNRCGPVIFSVVDGASGYLVKFVEVISGGEPELIEHMELKWLPAADLLQLSLAPSDRKFVEHLLAEADPQ